MTIHKNNRISISSIGLMSEVGNTQPFIHRFPLTVDLNKQLLSLVRKKSWYTHSYWTYRWIGVRCGCYFMSLYAVDISIDQINLQWFHEWFQVLPILANSMSTKIIIRLYQIYTILTTRVVFFSILLPTLQKSWHLYSDANKTLNHLLIHSFRIF